jgi:hypothetical protein
MENRERDRVSQRDSSTEAGDINRKTSQEKGRENSGTGTEFGQNIGRSENLGEEGGGMRNKQEDSDRNSSLGNEESRRPSGDSGFDSSTGRSGSMGGSRSDRSSSGSDIDRDSNLNQSQNDRSRRGGSSESEH